MNENHVLTARLSIESGRFNLAYPSVQEVGSAVQRILRRLNDCFQCTAKHYRCIEL